jgi:hypothetical protein
LLDACLPVGYVSRFMLWRSECARDIQLRSAVLVISAMCFGCAPNVTGGLGGGGGSLGTGHSSGTSGGAGHSNGSSTVTCSSWLKIGVGAPPGYGPEPWHRSCANAEISAGQAFAYLAEGSAASDAGSVTGPELVLEACHDLSAVSWGVRAVTPGATKSGSFHVGQFFYGNQNSPPMMVGDVQLTIQDFGAVGAPIVGTLAGTVWPEDQNPSDFSAEFSLCRSANLGTP